MQGMVFDGHVPVGTFVYSTAEDSYGYRKIDTLRLKSDYFDIPKNRSKKDLRFVVVEKVGENYIKTVEDLGFGSVSGRGWLTEQEVILKEAEFSKTPELKDLN